MDEKLKCIRLLKLEVAGVIKVFGVVRFTIPYPTVCWGLQCSHTQMVEYGDENKMVKHLTSNTQFYSV
jgi:hypothetical protein